MNQPDSVNSANRTYYQHMYHEAAPTTSLDDISAAYAANPFARAYHAALQRCITQHTLYTGKALEIGSGSGALQDLVRDYTGVDIATSSGLYVYKPFATCSATALPFKDATFDIVWSIWVLEHIPDPEAMLREVRRVLKPGGLFFLCAAWDVPPWVSQGYDVRPLRDLDWRGRLIKLSLLLRNQLPYRLGVTLLRRAIRVVRATITGDTSLAFGRLQPNYETYWSSDADACIAIDSHAVWQWMIAQGDQSIGIENALEALLVRHTTPLLFRVKPHERATHAR